MSSTQTFELHLRFNVSIDVGEATVTPVDAEVVPVADDGKPKGPTLVQPATGGPKRPARPRVTATPTVPPTTDPTKAGDEGKGKTDGDEPKADQPTGDNNDPATAGAGGPP